MAKEKATPVTNELKEALLAAGYTLENKNHPSQKAIAEALEVPAQRIYNAAKRPVPGQVYNEGDVNWDAINSFVLKHLDVDKGIGTVAEVVAKAKEIDENSKTADGRRARRTTAAKDDIILPDGTSYPARKMAIEVGQEVMLRSDKTPTIYTVVLTTETSIALQEKDSPMLKALSNWTINQKLIADTTKFEAVIAERQEAMAKAEAAAAEQAAQAEEVIEA